MTKISSAQKSFLDELVLNKNFLSRIKEIEAANEFEIPYLTNKILQDFGIPTVLRAQIESIIANTAPQDHVEGAAKLLLLKREEYEVSGSVYSSSEAKTSESQSVALQLNFDITREDLIKYIEDQWSSTIKPALQAVSHRKRVTSVRYPKKDAEIYSDYASRKKLGLTVRDIAQKHGVSVSKIYIIRDRQESFHN